MMHRACRSALIATCVVIVTGVPAGCGSTEPVAAAGTYSLATYGGAPLPHGLVAIVTVCPPGACTNERCDESLAASSIQLAADNSFNETDTLHFLCSPSGADSSEVKSANGSYQTQGSAITLTYAAASGIFPQTATGSVQSTVLEISQRVYGNGSHDPTSLVYTRK